MATGGEGTGSWRVKLLEFVKDQPAWLLTAIAIVLYGCLLIPALNAYLPQEYKALVVLGAFFFSVLAIVKCLSMAWQWVRSRNRQSMPGARFI